MNSLNKSYQYANREEVELTLQVKEGALPSEIFGVIYFTSMCGSLNSGGLPIPERHPGDTYRNPEFGTPQLAGDGMMFKLDFNTSGQANIKTLINKPPCYYADLATSRHNSPSIESKFSRYGFKSAGMTRASLQLGFRNELSVAVVPFQFQEDKHPRMMVTFDAGRPWEFNTQSLELITPIAQYDEWIKGTPPGLKFPFYLIQTSAHPSFDPVTKDFFTVNYTQKKSAGYQVAFFLLLLEHRDEVREKLQGTKNLFDKICYTIEAGYDIIQEIIQDIILFFRKSQEERRFKDLLKSILKKYNFTPEELEGKLEELNSENEVYLMHWDGKQAPLKKWKVVDEHGQDITIDECMHQTALTEDYILLSDSSFKFSADLLINNPFPKKPAIDRFLRKLLNKKTPVDITLYIVKRSDLKDDNSIVKAKKFPLPEDCIHYVANYKNPDDNITLYTINNNSVCVAEWIRPYDYLKIGGKPVSNNLVGLPAMSAMDLNALSKYVINCQNGIIDRKDCMASGGPPGNTTEPHTWEVCLFTHRDISSPNKAVNEIKDLFAYSAGLNSQRLTKFMYELFHKTPGKVIPNEEILKYTEAGVTQSLIRIETDGMTIKDAFMLEFNAEIRSIQFVPRREEREGVDYSVNGYVVCVMLVGSSTIPNDPVMDYERELWIFEADHLAQGPVCKLTHPELSYAFTLHSAWIEEAQEQDPTYQVSIREDYSNPQSILPWVQPELKDFFEKYVFPHFDQKKEVSHS